MPRKGRRGSFDVKAWLQEEYSNEQKFKANLRLLRGFSIFFGSIVVFRQFGEALFVSN